MAGPLIDSFAGVPDEFYHVVWTQSMRRLAVLVGRALRFGESVLLVGDTGYYKPQAALIYTKLSEAVLDSSYYVTNCFFNCSVSRCGKTTICQLFAALEGLKFFSVNCHLHMETSDFLGALRPVRHTEARKCYL